MKKLVEAVGKVFAREGYSALTAVKIASVAKVDRKLIYLYFGSLDNLLNRYFKDNDFWIPSYNKNIARILQAGEPLGCSDIFSILKGQFDNVLNNEAFRQGIQWEVSEPSSHMRAIADERERVGESLFALVEGRFPKGSADIRAVLALQIAGIYYLALHARVNGSLFCGIDINRAAGRRRIEKALRQLLDDTFVKADKTVRRKKK